MGKKKYWKKIEDSERTEAWQNELNFTKVTMRRTDNGYEVILKKPVFHNDGSIGLERNPINEYNTKSEARRQAMFLLKEDPDILLEHITAEDFGEAVQGIFADLSKLRKKVLDQAVEQLDGITIENHQGMPVTYGADHDGSDHHTSIYLTHPDQRGPIRKRMVSWYEVNPISFDLIVHDAAYKYYEMHEDDPLWLLSITGMAIQFVDSDLARSNLPKAPMPILEDIAGMAGTDLAVRYKDKEDIDGY